MTDEEQHEQDWREYEAAIKETSRRLREALGDKPIDADTAAELESLLTIPAEFWLRYERHYRTGGGKFSPWETVAEMLVDQSIGVEALIGENRKSKRRNRRKNTDF